MAVCAICFKSVNIGHLVSHAKNRVRHLRKPNLHSAHILVGGAKRRVMLCTQCKRTVRAVEKVAAETKKVTKKSSK
ncbi:TPA: 50S ribosomal protein L28 [Candidatus Woesearchaeota archaeon]|nr:50S ribosomal protein L28 [Candidatus Woesearchaeota archaeon]